MYSITPKLTPEQMDTVIRTVGSWYNEAVEGHEKWRETIAEDPHYALEWADNEFLHVGKLYMYSIILAQLLFRPDVTHEDRNIILAVHFRDMVLNARKVSGSTSRCSNLLEDAKRSAVASLMIFVDNLVAF